MTTARNFQSDIDGRLHEPIKDDKSRRMNKVDFRNCPGTGPLDNYDSLIYKINSSDGFITVTISGTTDDNYHSIIIVDLNRNTKRWKSHSDSNYHSSYELFKSIHDDIENYTSLNDVIDRYKLTPE